jgi:nucleoside phosphorylase
MLRDELGREPLRWAMTSHAIRQTKSTSSALHKVTRDWLQSVWATHTLPNARAQADNFIDYLGTSAVVPGDSVRCNPQHLGGLLGTADDPTGATIEGFTYIVVHLKAKGSIEQQGYPTTDGTTGYRLTVAGWTRFEELRRQSHLEDVGPRKSQEPKPAPEASAVMSARVVVLTALQVETEAVLRHLVDRGRQCISDTWFHTGRFDGWTIALAEAGPGNTPAAAIATRAVTHFNPEIAAFVGVAGGVKDVALGDVVVATKVYGYESGKETPDGFLPRSEVLRSHHELEQRGRVLRTDTNWHSRLDTALWRDRKPSVYVDPIAAGEAVVATNRGRIARLLKQHYSDALAVEMEGRGFLQAAHIQSGFRAVVVRGISDLLSGKARTDKLGWQQRAADAAASFFFEMLALERGSPPDRATARNLDPPPGQTLPAPINAEPETDDRASLAQVRQFHNERLSTFASRAILYSFSPIVGQTPEVPVLPGAILVMHLAPLHTFDAPQPSSFAEICRNPRSFPPIVDTAPRDWTISSGGLLTGSNSEGLGKPQRAYVYVFRSGALEAVVSSIARGRDHNALELPNIQSMIIHYARVYAASLYKSGINPPFAVFAGLARVKTMRLLQDFIGNAVMEDVPYGPLTADVLHFDEAIFESVPQDDNTSAKMLSPILNHMANAAGLAISPYFDAEGNYTLNVACPAG